MFSRIITLACVLTLAPLAQAITVTVDSVDYNVTTVRDEFTDISAVLMAQPWWGSSDVANAFAQAVGNSFGGLNGVWGPLFAYANSPTAFFGVSSRAYYTNTALFTSNANTVYYYGVATRVTNSVPDAGGTLPLGLLALVGAWFARRRLALRTS